MYVPLYLLWNKPTHRRVSKYHAFNHHRATGKKYHVNQDDNTLQKLVYGPTYVPYNEDGQKILLPQTTDMSQKDNLKLLYNSLPEGMCNNNYESLEQAINDVETFQYSHETSTKHVLVQGVYVGSAFPSYSRH